LCNRWGSLQLEIAEDQFIKYKKEHPFSVNNNKLSRDIYSKLDGISGSKFLKKIFLTDVSEPLQLMKYSGILAIIFLAFYFGMHHASISQLFLACSLATILFAENYINSKTFITADKITIPGCIAGIMISSVIAIFNSKTISGGFLYSICGVILGFAIIFSTAFFYELITKREGLGGGTVKLTAMIGAWVGLLILPIIAVAILIMIIQGLILNVIVHLLPGELKWSNNTLSPRLYRKIGELPTSISLALASWIVIILSTK
jgi:prepilin signal peptidase PulO-like enzyme (type II secretory pathway)